MSVEERTANFLFLYEDKGPHLNPHVTEKLKPGPGPDRDGGCRLQPDLPSPPPDPLSDLTAQFSNSTSAEMNGNVSSKEMLHPQPDPQVPHRVLMPLFPGPASALTRLSDRFLL